MAQFPCTYKTTHQHLVWASRASKQQQQIDTTYLILPASSIYFSQVQLLLLSKRFAVAAGHVQASDTIGTPRPAPYLNWTSANLLTTATIYVAPTQGTPNPSVAIGGYMQSPWILGYDRMFSVPKHLAPFAVLHPRNTCALGTLLARALTIQRTR